jgi:hypothetical protein
MEWVNKRVPLLLTATGLLFLLLASCYLTGVPIEERVYRFISDLNAVDRSNIYMNFHPDTADYLAIHDPAYLIANIEPPFPPVLSDPTPYSIVPGTLDTANEAAVTAQLAGPVAFGGPLTITCTMEKYGNDWQIRVLVLEVYGTVVQ